MLKFRKVLLGAMLLLGFAFTNLQAQDATLTSGGKATGTGGSADYSIGQLVYTTNTGTNGSMAMGVHQPYEISVATGIKESKEIYIDCLVYPNPTSDNLTLNIENKTIRNLSYQLIDINGKLLERKKIQENNTVVTMRNLVPAIYFLKIIEGQREVKTFKIIKN